MKTFYFVRQPDHMVDFCCDQNAHHFDIDTIKKKHKIFYTREEAEEYQKSFVIYPKEVAEQKNLDFIRNGLCEVYGYERKENKRKEKKTINHSN